MDSQDGGAFFRFHKPIVGYSVGYCLLLTRTLAVIWAGAMPARGMGHSDFTDFTCTLQEDPRGVRVGLGGLYESPQSRASTSLPGMGHSGGGWTLWNSAQWCYLHASGCATT
jgi:hypothetical protein